MNKYDPVPRTYDIANGQLVGFTPRQCFVLGYQLALFDEAMKRPEEFTQLMDCSNIPRVKPELEKSGRDYRFTFMTNDSSETWVSLRVDKCRAS